jgi:hypothetical protein
MWKRNRKGEGGEMSDQPKPTTIAADKAQGEFLLPCPFCGSENVGVESLTGGFVVDCKDCGGGCGTCHDEQAARDEWNKRKSLTEILTERGIDSGKVTSEIERKVGAIKFQQLHSQLAAAQAAIKGHNESNDATWKTDVVPICHGMDYTDTTALDAAIRNSHKRLYDLVRYCRANLHQAKLITDEEYARLVETGSVSARRLEDYEQAIAAATKELADELKSTTTQLATERHNAAAAQQSLVDALKYIAAGEHADEAPEIAQAALAKEGKS